MLTLKRGKENAIVCRKIILHKNILSQGTGLMFHRKIKDEAHIFPFVKKHRISLTMWFVFFPIDVIYLDEKKRAVEMKENFRPFTNYFPKKEAMYVVELPCGFIAEKKIKLADFLVF